MLKPNHMLSLVTCSKLVVCLFGECPDPCIIQRSWQHTGVVHLSIQTYLPTVWQWSTKHHQVLGPTICGRLQFSYQAVRSAEDSKILLGDLDTMKQGDDVADGNAKYFVISFTPKRSFTPNNNDYLVSRKLFQSSQQKYLVV